MLLHPHAKINLGLFIKGRLPNGYHTLETLLYPLNEGVMKRDELEVLAVGDAGIQIQLEGFNETLPDEQNLVWKAWRLFRDAYPALPGIRARLKKNIPAGAGLGGGSSDAAHMLLALNEIAGNPLPLSALEEMGAKLGADVPFFLHAVPMFATGTGTELQDFPVSIPGRIEVICPGIHSSTPEAYKGLDLSRCDPSRNLKQVLALPVSQWKDALVNDLEEPVFRRFPQLREIKTSLYERGAVYAAMSGSGSAVFGIF